MQLCSSLSILWHCLSLGLGDLGLTPGLGRSFGEGKGYPLQYLAWRIPWIITLTLIAFISHASKVMLKSLQARLQEYMNHGLPDVQTGFRKCRGTRDQIANVCWIIEKEESSRKTSISALLTMPKPLTEWITTNCGKF